MTIMGKIVPFTKKNARKGEKVLMNKVLLIGCEVLKTQIERQGKIPADAVYLEQLLHRTPDKLRQELQQLIDRSGRYQTLLFAYGLCSNAIIGLRGASGQRLIIPRSDDCIGLVLGSRQRYLDEFRKNSGTYYFTAGWVDGAPDPLKEYWKNIEQYGEEDSRWIAEETLKHYTRALFIQTGDDRDRFAAAYVRQFADFFRLRYEEIAGSDTYLRKLIYGPWEDDFVIVENGAVITSELFADPD